MKAYIVAIGGTGHRCIEPIIHFASSGLLECDELEIIFVDADEGNGNLKRTSNVLKNYKSIKKMKKDDFLKTDINNDFNTNLWSPLSETERKRNFSNEKDLEKIFNYQLMEPSQQRLFNFLYTKKEMTESLLEGFYGHPSIGAALMIKNINSKNSTMEEFVKKINNTIENDIKIFLIASVFGGTGAAGFPTIANYINNNVQDKNLIIGGILVLPYFKFESLNDENKGNLNPNASNFYIKSKSALYYYLNENFYNEIFDRIYMIGSNHDELVPVEGWKGNKNQKNPPHIIELYVAIAFKNFLCEKIDKNKNEKLYFTFKNEKKNKASHTWNLIEEISVHDGQNKKYIVNVKDKLFNMLRFSIAYTKYFYPIAKGVLSESSERFEEWYLLHFNKYYIKKERDEIINGLNNMKEYCSNFIDWINDMTKNIRGENIKLFSNTINKDLFNKSPYESFRFEGFERLDSDEENINRNMFREILRDMCVNSKTSKDGIKSFFYELYQNSHLR